MRQGSVGSGWPLARLTDGPESPSLFFLLLSCSDCSQGRPPSSSFSPQAPSPAFTLLPNRQIKTFPLVNSERTQATLDTFAWNAGDGCRYAAEEASKHQGRPTKSMGPVVRCAGLAEKVADVGGTRAIRISTLADTCDRLRFCREPVVAIASPAGVHVMWPR